MDKKQLLQIQADVTKKQILLDQLIYNMNKYPLSIQEKAAVKTVIKELEISVNQMSKVLK